MEPAKLIRIGARLSHRDRSSGMEELFKLLAELMVYLLLGAHFGVSAHFSFLARELFTC